MNNKTSRLEFEETIKIINLQRVDYLKMCWKVPTETIFDNSIKEGFNWYINNLAHNEAILINKKVNDIMNSDSNISAQEASDYIVFNETINSTLLDAQITNNCINAQKSLKKLFQKYNLYTKDLGNNIDYLVSEDFFTKIHLKAENIGKTWYSNEDEYMFVEEKPLPNWLSFLSYRPIGDVFEVELMELGEIESWFADNFDNEVEIFTRLNDFAKKLKNAWFNVKAWIDGEHLSIRFDGQKLRIWELEKLFELAEEFKGEEEE